MSDIEHELRSELDDANKQIAALRKEVRGITGFLDFLYFLVLFVLTVWSIKWAMNHHLFEPPYPYVGSPYPYVAAYLVINYMLCRMVGIPRLIAIIPNPLWLLLGCLILGFFS